MQLAVLSDIHDHLENLERALQQIERQNAELLFCCGDLCSPFVIDQLCKFGGNIHVVFGNNDADLFRITGKAAKQPRLHLHGELYTGTVDGVRIAMQHYDTVARPLASSACFDAVFFGHNHVAEVSTAGACLLLNPGPVMGAAFPGGQWKRVPASYALFDTRTRTAQLCSLDDSLDGGEL